MEAKVTKRTHCRLCDSPRVELIVPLAPTPIAEKYVTAEDLDRPTPCYPIDIYLCEDCGHTQILHVIDPEVIYADYTYRSSGTPVLVSHFEGCAELVLSRRGDREPGLVVDIGSNDGSLLQCFKQRGAQVLGVDPAEVIAAEATAAGVPTLPEFYDTALAARIRKERGPASVVCAFNVYAHVDDMCAMTRAIASLLADDGLFMFEVSYVLDIVDHMLLGTIFHEHLSHHAVTPLIPFLEKCGLQLIHVERNGIQGGSFVGLAQGKGGPFEVDPSVAKLVVLEEERGICRAPALRGFAERLSEMKKDVDAILDRIEREGARLWGYGAARSGTTLLAQMGLGDAVETIIDDHPDKCGRYSPGDHIPVVPTAKLLEEMPEYAIILAWVHTERIIENNKAYLEGGGKLIRCFPQVSVVTAAG